MRSPFRHVASFGLVVLFSGLVVGCGGDHNNPPPPPTLSSIAVTPASPSIKVGAQQQFTATGTLSDHTTKDLTSQVTWSSGTTATATISAGGNATAVAGGTSTITATMNGISGSTILTVVSLSSIAVTPLNPSIPLGLPQQFTATGTFSDNSTQDITTQVTWNSATLAVATISTAGLASTLTVGTSVITASLGSITSPPSTLTVVGAVRVSVQITPANPTIAVGQTENFTAAILLSDGTTQPVVGPLTWTSDTTTTASIIPDSGICSAAAVGTSQIGVTDAHTSLTGSTSLTVVAATSRFAYAPNLNDQSISIYAINSTTGVLLPVGVQLDVAGPTQVVPGPSGKFAYVLGGSTNLLSTFAIDPATGALLPSGIPPTPLGGIGGSPFEGTVDPTGRFLYVANSSLNNVSVFSLDPATGAPTSIGSAVTVGSGPVQVILDRMAKFLYVVNDDDDTINGFAVQSDGSLQPLSTPSFATGSFPVFAAIDPSNSFLYVPNSGDNTISVFSIAATGLLSEIGGSPFSIASLNAPFQALADPSGKFLLVTNSGDGVTPGSVSVVNVGSGGALGAEVTNSPFTAGLAPTGVAMDASTKVVSVANDLDNTISTFSFNSSTGALTPTSTIQTQVSPLLLNFSIGVAPTTVSVANAFASNSGSNDISAFTAASATGVLSPAASSPFASNITGNTAAVADLAGATLFTASPTPNAGALAAFSITQSSAALASVASPIVLSDTLGSLYAEPSGRFIYAADLTTKDVVIYSSTLVSPGVPTFGTLPSLNAIVGDPGGTLIFALGDNAITPANFSTNSSALTPGSPQTIAGSWKMGVVDPSGHFLVALDSTANTLHSFAITAVTRTPGVDGTLTDTASFAPAGGTATSAVAFDPLGRFVFVTDSTAKTVTVFGFNSSTGAINSTALATVTLTSAANGVAADATGTYLYVSVLGNPTANPIVPGSIAAFSIGATGALTPVANSPFPAGTGTSAVVVTNQVH